MKLSIASCTLCITFTLLLGCGSVASKNLKPTTSFKQTPKATWVQQKGPLNPLELQSLLMGFADTTNSRLAQFAEELKALGTPQARLTAARMQVYDYASNVEIAAGPYPGIALLDMIVVTSLRRMVWEDYWLPRVFGEQPRSLIDTLHQAEKDIWAIASMLLTSLQMDDLVQAIIKWRKVNPRQVAINYVRFSDFGELGLKPSMHLLTTPGGLFASIQETARVAQDMKVAIDRAFYLMSRMQLVINAQMELAYLELIFQPEADGMVDTTQKLSALAGRYAEIAESLPVKISGETSMLINQLFAHLEKNRDDTISKVMTELTRWQKSTIKNVMSSISTERQAAIDHAVLRLTQQQKTLYNQVDAIVLRSGDEAKEVLKLAFIFGEILIITLIGGLMVYRAYSIRLRRK